jgi:hypothetical protein
MGDDVYDIAIVQMNFDGDLYVKATVNSTAELNLTNTPTKWSSIQVSAYFNSKIKDFKVVLSWLVLFEITKSLILTILSIIDVVVIIVQKFLFIVMGGYLCDYCPTILVHCDGWIFVRVVTGENRTETTCRESMANTHEWNFRPLFLHVRQQNLLRW